MCHSFLLLLRQRFHQRHFGSGIDPFDRHFVGVAGNYLDFHRLQSVFARDQNHRPAVAGEDREPASETAVAQDAVDLSQLVKSAGEAPQADCQNSEPSQPQGQPQQREVAIVQKKAAAPLSPEIASHYLRPTVQVQTNAPEIQELARRLTQNKPDDLSIAMAIHDWVAENIGYDTKAYFNEFQEKKPFTKSYDALSVLGSNDRVAICTGYANLTLALLLAANTPDLEVEGLIHYTSTAPKTTCDQTDNNPEYHAWIETWVDGKWMPMDTTADAGTVDFKAQTFTRAPSQKYMDPDLFNATHSRCRVEEYY